MGWDIWLFTSKPHDHQDWGIEVKGKWRQPKWKPHRIGRMVSQRRAWTPWYKKKEGKIFDRLNHNYCHWLAFFSWFLSLWNVRGSWQQQLRFLLPLGWRWLRQPLPHIKPGVVACMPIIRALERWETRWSLKQTGQSVYRSRWTPASVGNSASKDKAESG